MSDFEDLFFNLGHVMLEVCLVPYSGHHGNHLLEHVSIISPFQWHKMMVPVLNPYLSERGVTNNLKWIWIPLITNYCTSPISNTDYTALLNQFHSHLYDRHFIIQTDHAALQWLTVQCFLKTSIVLFHDSTVE